MTFAAWVQAVVTAHSIEKAGRRQSILAVAEAADEGVAQILEAIQAPDPRAALMLVYDRSIVDSIVNALSVVPAYEVGSPDAVLALLQLRDQFVFLGAVVQRFLDGPWKDPDLKTIIDSAAMT